MSAIVIAETIRRHLSSAGYIAALVLIAFTGLFASGFARPGSMWPSLVGLMTIITGAAIIGPEFSTGALQLIVSRPIRRSTYLLSRVTGVFASVALATVTGLAAEIAGRLVRARAMPWSELATVFGGRLATSLLVIAMLTFLGSLTRAYWNAAIYVGIEAALGTAEAILGSLRMRPSTIGELLESHPGIERGLATIDDILFTSAPEQLTAQWLARVLVTVAIALALACVAFERREVPYGSD